MVDSTILWFGGFHNEGVKIGDKEMIMQIGKTKVALTVVILLVTIVFAHAPIDQGVTTNGCDDVTSLCVISQTAVK